MNFKEYFTDEYQYSLKSIAYEAIESEEMFDEIELNCSDEISGMSVENGIELTFLRKVFFNPKSMFELTVTFGIRLFYVDNTKEINIEELLESLKKEENAYLSNIISRASLLISVITSSYGQNPVVTPPVFIKWFS